jgi:predicted RecB family endonuclease
MTPGTRLVNAIMLALSDAGCLVWRNTTGQAYQGRVIHNDGRQVTLAESRVIVFGLCVGSADIIGITPDGRFLAVEVKAGKDTIKPEQQRFIDAVQAFGGCAGFARSVQDALDIINS